MARMQAPVLILQQVQVLDQQVAAALAIAEQRPHLVQRLRLDLPAFRMVEAASPARAGMDAAIVVARLGHLLPFTFNRHCERSEAISGQSAQPRRDCFVAALLAMTTMP